MSDDLIHRGEFNAAMHGVRESLDAVKDGLLRVEAKQDAFAQQNIEGALKTAHDAGRVHAELEGLWRRQAEDRKAAEARSDKVAADAERRSAAQDLKIWGLLIGILGLLVGLIKVMGG